MAPTSLHSDSAPGGRHDLLVGRDAELAALTDLYDDTAQGRGRLGLLSGTFGAGKSELVGALADRARSRGALVLEALASASEEHLALGVIGQLLHHADVPADLGTDVFAETGRHEPGPGDPAELPASDDAENTRLTQAITLALLRLAEERPVVVVVDDLQHADAASVRCLRFVARRMRAARLLIVLTASVHSEHHATALYGELLRMPHSRRLHLTNLDADGIRDLLITRTGGPVADATVADWTAATRGNPLLVTALLRDTAETCAIAPTPGDAFRHAVADCLHNAGPATYDVGLAVAVRDTVVGAAADDDSATADLARLTGLGPVAVDSALDGLDAAGMLVDGRLAHAGALLAHASTDQLRVLRMRAATLLHDRGAEPSDVAAVLVAADDAAPDWAPDVLIAAADRALRADETAFAVECLELARRFCTDDRRLTLVGMLATAQWRRSPATGDRHFAELTASVVTGGSPTAGCLPGVVRYLIRHGRPQDVARALDGGGTGGAGAPPAEIEALRLLTSCVYPPVGGPAAPAAPPLDLAYGSVADTQVRVARTFGSVLAGTSGSDALAEAEQVLQSTRLSDETVQSIGAALAALVYSGHTDRAATWCDRLLAETVERRATSWQGVFAGFRAEIAVRQGDVRSARQHADDALTLIPAANWGVEIARPLASLVVALTTLGEHDRAEAVLARPVPDGVMHTVYAPFYLHARGHHYLATDRCYAALRDFMACGALMTSWQIDQPTLVPWRTDAAQAHLRLGDRAKAADLVDEQLNLVGDDQPLPLGITLRVLANTHDLAQRPRLLMSAIDEIQASGNRVELARALADLGRAHHALQDTSQARMRVRQAWHVAKECAAESVCSELLPHLGITEAQRLGDNDTGGDGLESLTTAEHRTATLAAHGCTNREIADRLFITVSTVEQHLTRVYKKLGVRKRTDLPAGLEQAPPAITSGAA